MPRDARSRSYLRRSTVDTNSARKARGCIASPSTTVIFAAMQRRNWDEAKAVWENSARREESRWGRRWQSRERRRVRIWATTRVPPPHFSWLCSMYDWAGGWGTRGIRTYGRARDLHWDSGT